MRGTSIREKFGYMFKDLEASCHAPNKIDSTNVFQEANQKTRHLMDSVAKASLLPGSRVEGTENFQEFYRQMKAGKRGLILCEHYGNMDFPIINYLIARDCGKEGKDFENEVVAIAGLKLNEENPMIRAWTEAYTRIVIYPSRTIATISDPEERAMEEEKSRKINFASLRAMDEIKKQHRPILVFPAGTRYRPGKPDTKKGVREIDSYLRLFDIMILITENGNILRINPESPDDMLSDLYAEDTIILGVSPVIDCKKFRNDVLSSLDDYDGDKKTVVVDKVMEKLQSQHDFYKPIYEKTFKEQTGLEPDVEQ